MQYQLPKALFNNKKKNNRNAKILRTVLSSQLKQLMRTNFRDDPDIDLAGNDYTYIYISLYIFYKQRNEHLKYEDSIAKIITEV